MRNRTDRWIPGKSGRFFEKGGGIPGKNRRLFNACRSSFGRKWMVTVFILSGLLTGIHAQTLFTYSGKPVSREDFLRAYSKNNTAPRATEKSYRDYLELYIRYKLKVQAAYDARMDTLPSQSAELQNFRTQLAENFMNDAESVDKLVREAFVRGQKDLHLAHIFVALPAHAGASDTVRAWQKIQAAYAQLRQGKDFGETALQYSEDPSVKDNRGDIGYIAVFTLPYELESLAYNTVSGHYSKPYRSKGGYHIFRNLGERKSWGTLRAAQVLLSFPLQATDADKAAVRHTADSVYNLLIKGADFGEMAKKVSGDNLSYQTGGEMAPFGVGRYEPAFETAAFALDKDGAISAPVSTAFGFHIIRRLGRQPFPRDSTKEAMVLLKKQVQDDPRIEYSKKAMLHKILQETRFSLAPVDENRLWAYTDSASKGRPLGSFPEFREQSILFSFAKKSKTLKDWTDYVKVMRQMPGGATKRVSKELLDQFVQVCAFDYYRDHLEDYNSDFAFQMNEFKEGNLLFEVMQHTIWDKASSDSLGLKAYYEAHKDKYWWEPSADAILFTAANEKTAKELQAKLQQDPMAWRKWVEASGGLVQADSGRFELAQIPVVERTRFSAGLITSFVTNPADNTVSFSYILRDYPDRSLRNYQDARGFVINDYQGWLEEQWLAGLRRKYPVKIDEAVFSSLPK